jgi:type IV pilus biogenesis protein CpaD/CtpE
MEKVEHAAHITFVATLLGGARSLTEEQLEKLRRVSVHSYGKDFSTKIACEIPDATSADLTESELRQYISQKLQELGISSSNNR